jgi:hypothetical protein
MIAHTWEHHPDYESLCKALKMLQSVTDFVNKDIATSSALTKVLHIQNSLGGEIQVCTFPRLLKCVRVNASCVRSGS